MNEELIQHQLDTHEKRLNNYSGRLDKLEQDGVELKTELKNLCENIRTLTTTMKWFIGLMVGSFVAFFFYAAQRGLIK
jgi:chromosome segregation ATPase